jgi:hypothetical protein
MVSNAAKLVLPTRGKSYDATIEISERLLRDLPDKGGIRDDLLKSLRFAKHMKTYLESLAKVIERNQKRGVYETWPQKIRIDNEYGTMFTLDFGAIPPLYSPYQGKADFFRYTCVYFDDQLVLVEEGNIMERTKKRGIITHPKSIIFNRIAPEIYERMQQFFKNRRENHG